MSINNIELRPVMLEGLYSNVLLENHVKNKEQEQGLKFLGNNKNNVLVVVSNPELPFMPDSELNFFTNILNACKLGLADIALINLAKTEMEFDKFMKDLKPDYIILFAVTPPEIGLPVNFPQFQVQQFDSRKWIHAPSLSELESDKSQKQKLWISLKAMFGI